MTMSWHALALFARGGRAAVHHSLLHQLGALPGDLPLNPQP
jgi:hypothetical protein